jgi:hypothetical protein
MEFTMSIKTKFAALAVAALITAGSVASTTTPAEAWGLSAGAGAAIAIAANNPYPYGHAHCGFVRHYDAFGNYIGTVRTCS